MNRDFVAEELEEKLIGEEISSETPKTNIFLSAERRRALERISKCLLGVGVVFRDMTKKNFTDTQILEMLALLDIYDLSKVISGYYAASAKEYNFTCPPGTYALLEKLSEKAMYMFKQLAILPDSPLYTMDVLLREIFSDCIMDPECMRTPDRSDACFVTEFMYEESRLNIDPRTTSREILQASVTAYLRSKRQFVDTK